MGVLDELRGAMTTALEPRCVLTYVDQQNQFQWLRALKVIDIFEEEHPGLEGWSHECTVCGNLCSGSVSIVRFVDVEWFQRLSSKDHDLYDDLYCVDLCPACAKEAGE